MSSGRRWPSSAAWMMTTKMTPNELTSCTMAASTKPGATAWQPPASAMLTAMDAAAAQR